MLALLGWIVLDDPAPHLVESFGEAKRVARKDLFHWFVLAAHDVTENVSPKRYLPVASRHDIVLAVDQGEELRLRR